VFIHEINNVLITGDLDRPLWHAALGKRSEETRACEYYLYELDFVAYCELNV